MRELELKLAVDESFTTPSLPPENTGVAEMQELPALDLRASYYDTSDLRLARYGITLRYRGGEGEQSGWSLKLPFPAEDAAAREELHFEGSPRRVPDRARDLITAFARSDAVAPVARLRSKRRRWCLRDGEGKELAELVDDKVSVLENGRVVNRFRELEVEARALDRPGLERIAAALQEDGASALAPVPKVVRVLGSKAALPPDVWAPTELSPLDPAARAVQAAVARGVQRVLVNDPGTRLGEEEPLHQMRVGARRLRSDLRLFGPLVDRDWADGLRGELRSLGDTLGPVRDLDVMLAQLRGGAAGLDGLEPLFEELEERRRAARQELSTALGSRRYLDLLEALVRAANDPLITAKAWEQSQTALPPLAKRAWGELAKEVRSLSPGDPDERFHRVRILAKRSRYAAEAVAPALGADRGRKALRFARRAAKIQDVLGTLQDTAVAREIIQEVVGERPKDGTFAVAAGRLIERQEQAAREARAGFAKAWQKLDRSKQRAWLTK